MPKQKLEYWKRYDLMFKNYSKKDLVLILEHELIHNCLVPRYIRGRRTIVRKERIISFIMKLSAYHFITYGVSFLYSTTHLMPNGIMGQAH